MDNNLTGLQKITDRILADAEAEAAKTLDEAKKAAEAHRAEVIAGAESKAADITARAGERAAVLIENAKAGADTKARSERLYVKNEYAAKAVALAKERFIACTGEEKLSAYAALLTEAVNTCIPNGAKAVLAVNEKDGALASRVIEKARPAFVKAVDIAVSDTFIADKAGFVLHFGDIDVRCVEDTLFGELDGPLKKAVLDVLFAE